jgi:hypothetical protein
MALAARVSLVLFGFLATCPAAPSMAAEPAGGRGPDVLGFRIGMTPAEARSLMKSNVLVTPSLQRNHREQFEALGYTLSYKQYTVPNSKYLCLVSAAGKEPDGSSKQWWVVFSPVPGRETVVSLHRVEVFPPSQRPTYSAFKQALVEKYGSPTVMDPRYPSMFRWYFDAGGGLVKPGPRVSSDVEVGYCLRAQQQVFDGQWILRNMPQIPDHEQLPRRCGAFFLEVVLGFENVTYDGPQSIVNQSTTYLVGFDEALRSFDAAGALIDKDRAAVSGEKIRTGQKQKPTL